MGRRRFRLADMMPNSWFYKLRDMRRPWGHPPAVASGGAASAVLPSSSPLPQRGARSATRPASPRRRSVALTHRMSYYYPTRDRELPAPEPRDAATQEEDRHKQLLPQQQSPPSCSRRRHRVGAVRIGRGLEAKALAGAHDAHHSRRRDMYVRRDGSSDEDDDVYEEVRRPAVTAPSDYSVNCKVIASETDIVIDLCSEGAGERVLRPIVTRPPAMREVVRYGEVKDRHVVDVADTAPAGGSSASEQGSRSHPRRPSVSVGRRLRTRVTSPRLASTTTTTTRPSRKGSSKPTTTPGASPRKTTPLAPAPPAAAALAESFAVVKSSADPRRDFRESMEEMIAEKGIRGAGDLEDLLACYLALNAAEHHDLIVEVFEEIWASLAVAGAGADP